MYFVNHTFDMFQAKLIVKKGLQTEFEHPNEDSKQLERFEEMTKSGSKECRSEKPDL